MTWMSEFIAETENILRISKRYKKQEYLISIYITIKNLFSFKKIFKKYFATGFLAFKFDKTCCTAIHIISYIDNQLMLSKAV